MIPNPLLAALIFVLLLFTRPISALDPCPIARTTGSSAGARAGTSVVADSTHFAIGVPGLDAVWVGVHSTGTDPSSVVAVLTGPAGSGFGSALAVLDGELFIGAPLQGTGGVVHRYQFSTTPTFIELLEPATSPGARAGSSLSVAGGLLVVGAPRQGMASAPSGAAFCYRLSGNDWLPLPPLLPPDGHAEGGFGEAVATDGAHLAIGAPRAPGGDPESGSVSVFRLLPDQSIAPLAVVIDLDGVNDDGFGAAVTFLGAFSGALGGAVGSSSDLAIGVPHRTPVGATVPGGGAVDLVAGLRIAGWPVALPGSVPVVSADHTLTRDPSGTPPPATAAGFGGALAFGNDRLWIGSPTAGHSAPLAGVVTSFHRNGPAIEAWVEEETISSSSPAIGADFGRALAATADRLLVGLPGDPTGCGGAFGCDSGGFEWFAHTLKIDCDGDSIPDLCAISLDPALDLDGDGRLDRCNFRRGDIDGNGGFDLADPISWLFALASAGTIPIGGDCPAAWDANGDAVLDLADPISLLSYLFVGGAAPPAPFPSCGPAPGIDPFHCETECLP